MPDGGRGAPLARGLRRCRPALGSFVEIALPEAPAEPRPQDLAALAAAFAAVERVAALMSFHDPASDLSRLNAGAHAAPVAVHPWTRDVLLRAATLFAHTDGRFDCTVGGALVDAGILPRRSGHALDGAATFADVVVGDDGRVAYRRPLVVDLGGIAKGYAVDRAVDALVAHGVRAAVVNAGGDLRVLGPEPVPIHVRHGDAVSSAGFLADGAFATSAAWRPGRVAQAPSALVDPVTGAFADAATTWSVLAPDCATADALTKVLALAGDLDAACRARFDAVPLVHRAA